MGRFSKKTAEVTAEVTDSTAHYVAAEKEKRADAETDSIQGVADGEWAAAAKRASDRNRRRRRAYR